MVKQYPYQSCFAELLIKPLVSEARDKYLAMASLIEVKEFLPSIDTAVNLDLLPVAFNACVVNRANKNKDIIDTETALAVYKHFINKPINIEHNRQRVIGVILTAGFSEFGTDSPLTEEQVKNINSPFNITLGGVIWRIVCPELAEHIEESGDPTSDKYLSVSASWELGFTGYKIALMESGLKNLAEAKTIIVNAEEIDKIKDKLTACGGDGKFDDLFMYRMPAYDVLPLGIGFTEKPAAEVKGVVTSTPPPSTSKSVNPTEAEMVEAEKISQSIKSAVKIERNINMKITSLKDITDETLSQCTASAIAEFIATELKKGSDEWEQQKNALNTQLAQAQTDSQKLQTEQAKLQEQLQKVLATVETLTAEKTERENVDKFNSRMSTIVAEYELDDEVRAAIVEEVKALASDEDFAKWQNKAKVLLKGFAKKKCDDKKKEEKKEKEEKGEAKASVVVNDAIDNGKKEGADIPNGTSATSPSLAEKYAAAFTKENFVIS